MGGAAATIKLAVSARSIRYNIPKNETKNNENDASFQK